MDGYKLILLKRSFSDTSRIKDLESRVKTYNAGQTDIKNIFLENNVDIVLHCATDYGRKNPDPAQIEKTNFTFPSGLLELAKQHGVSSFINTDTILNKGLNPYAFFKKQFVERLKTYEQDLCCVNVALEHFYGPGDSESKFIIYLIKSLLGRAEKIDLTPGQQQRDFIYIDDVVSAFSLIIRHSKKLGKGYFEFEVGTGNLISIKDLVLKVQKLTKNTVTKLNFGALAYRDNEPTGHKPDLTGIKKLGWQCEHSLEEGLKKTINSSI